MTSGHKEEAPSGPEEEAGATAAASIVNETVRGSDAACMPCRHPLKGWHCFVVTAVAGCSSYCEGISNVAECLDGTVCCHLGIYPKWAQALFVGVGFDFAVAEVLSASCRLRVSQPGLMAI